MNDATSSDCLRSAFAAILKGDAAERDRLCRRAAVLMTAEKQADAIEAVLRVDFYVKSNGVAISSLAMARAAGALQ